MNVTVLEVELIAICFGLISTIEDQEVFFFSITAIIVKSNT